MSARPRLAVLGCGSIAAFHVPACREEGFDVVAVAGSPGSRRAVEFARRFDIPNVCSDPREVAGASSKVWDALLIATSVDPTLELLMIAAESGRPVLVEKPVASSAATLQAHAESWQNVIVAYNRRFYATAQAAKEFVEHGGPCLVQLELPEDVPILEDGGDQIANTRKILWNSVHGFDLARFVLGDLEVEAVVSRGEGRGRDGAAAIMRSRRGDVVQYTGNWNAPSNFSLTIDRGPRRYQMRPFEVGAYYEGTEVIEPTPDVPIRRYLPRRTGEVSLEPLDARFKPGFAGQARDLMRLCEGTQRTVGATIHDAIAALEVAERVLATNVLEADV